MKWRSVFVGVLLVAFLSAAGAAETKVEYLAVFVGGKKLGYVKHVREAAAGKVTTSQDMVLTIKRMNIAMEMRQSESSVETADGKPLSFKTVQDFGIVAQTIEGTVKTDGTVEVVVSSGQKTNTTTMAWPEGAVLPEGLRLLSASKGLKEGTSYTAKAFTGSMLKALDVEVTIGPAKDVDLLGRVVRLTEAKTVMTGPSGRIESTSYVDENFDALKTIVPMMGMQLEMVVCSKAVAMSESDTLDFFDKLLVASPAPLENVRSASSISYSIEPTGENARLEFLATPSQKVVRKEKGGFTITVAPVSPAKGGALPYKGDDPAATEALKPTRYLQCDTKEIAGLAKIAVGKAADAAEAAGRIESYVAKYISEKTLSVGYATALEVAKSKQGDCSEHAVLAAAMCRAVGVPAQVVTGLAYVSKLGARSNVFVPHAWFRVHISGKWIDYDAALRGYGAGHIALAAGHGEPEDFFSVVNTLGYFKIVEVSVKR
ncbi:MAG: transglutaminase domain-containing protein [Phycisphaerae bacterium]